MKKIMFTGVLTLFMGGMVQAATITIDKNGSEKTTSEQELLTEASQATEDVTIISGPHTDEGGTYYIISDSNSCRKVYVECSKPGTHAQ